MKKKYILIAKKIFPAFKTTWPKDWLAFPETQHLDRESLQRLRIRHPLYFSTDKYRNENGVPYRLIKYIHKSLIRYLKAHPPLIQVSQQKFKCLKSLKIRKYCCADMSEGLLIKKLFHASPDLKTIDLNQEFLLHYSARKHLQCLKKLSFLHISGLTNLNIPQIQSIFQRGLLNLETLTVKAKAFSKLDQTLICELFKQILKLPSLKRFKFATDTTGSFDVNTIPFDQLKEKMITYDIRVAHSAQTFTPSLQNTLALQEVKFLGISPTEGLPHMIEWKIVTQEHLRLQNNCHKPTVPPIFS